MVHDKRVSMNESYFDNLTDAELRQELQKYGFPVMPVTETTRKLLIKRLKNHVLNGSTSSKKSTPANTRRSVQSNVSPSRRQTASPGRRPNASPSRRQTTAGIMNSNAYGKSNANNDSPDYVTTPVDYKNNKDYYYLSNEGRSYLNRDSANYANGRSITSRLPTCGDKTYNTTPTNSKYSSNLTSKSSPKIYVPPPILSSDLQFNTRSESNRSSRDFDRSALKNGKETPGVVSRLLKLRDRTIGRSPINTSSFVPLTSSVNSNYYISDSDSDSGSPTRHSSLYNKRPNRTFSNSVWNRFNIKSKFKQSSVPYMLSSCLGLFFLILAVLYISKPPDMPSTMLERSTTFTLCEELINADAFAKPSLNCIDNDLLAPSLALNKELIQLLQTNIETHYCKDRSVAPGVSGTEFMKHLYKKRTNDAHKLLKSFHAAIYLIDHNPQWKIQILNRKEDQQLVDIYKDDIHFGLLKPYLPLKCLLLNKMQRFFLFIGIVFVVATVMGIIYVLWRFWSQRKQMRLKIVENFTKEIIKELVNRSTINDNSQGEVIINHLRDKLIPLNKRKSYLWAWNEALEKLEAYDSRIQFGCILQNGVEFRTMKWVESIISTPSSSSPNSSVSSLQRDNTEQRLNKKHWQSPAFDNVNKIPVPPTPCLKIRHMFDASEAHMPDLKQNIMESILEKVGPQCRIDELQLDRQSCCVYIRCATVKDAGIIHNEINGWWFDNRLVSIKFLRLDRYNYRFHNSTSNE